MSNVHSIRIKSLLFIPLHAEQVADRIADSSAHRRQSYSIKALDVDRPDLHEFADDEERDADPGTIGNHKVRTDSTQRRPCQPKVPNGVQGISGRRKIGPRNPLAAQGRGHLGLIKCHPVTFMLAPPRLQ